MALRQHPKGASKETAARGFGDNFRAERFEDGEAKYTTSRLMAPKAAIDVASRMLDSARSGRGSARGTGGAMSSARMASGRKGGDYGYALIRSDIDDLPVDIPKIPGAGHAGFLKQRTIQKIKGHMKDKDMVDDDGKILAWVDGDWFQRLSSAAILVNALAIGLDTESKGAWWEAIEHGILIFFCVELALRLLRHRWEFFSHDEDWTWNWFDFTIVLLGIFDQWLLPVILTARIFKESKQEESEIAKEETNFFVIMRLVRLLRILRLFRLVRMIRPLRELVQGVTEALQGVFWVLVFMVMSLYSVAILCTRLIGHGDVLPADLADEEDVLEIRAMFTTVPDSMFTLFGTMSSWTLLKFVPLFEELPLLKPIFVLFYVYSAWALLAVMTGVVSENMIAIREQMMKEDQQREEMRKTLITKILLELFQEADVDRSGTVSRQEFDAMLQEPELVTKITKNTHLKVQDLQDLFQWLDHDGGGTITIDEFMVGFKWVNEPLRAKSLVKLQECVAGDLKCLGTSVTQGVDSRAAEVHKLVTAPLRKVHAITEQMQSLDVHFREVKAILREQNISAPTAEEYQLVETRLHGQLDEVFRHFAKMKRRGSQSSLGSFF